LLQIEFGCGTTPTKKGFKTCDIRDVKGVDFVCPAWDIDKHVKPESVSEVFSRHFFEHLTFPQGKAVLEVWHKILIPGGVCEMSMPNMTFHIKQWISRRNSKEFNHACAGFWGWQRGKFDDVWDVHKSGYDEQSMRALLESMNYENIVFLENEDSPHLHVKCNKGS
jgi:predicted SAM-dependent methyltransferase